MDPTTDPSYDPTENKSWITITVGTVVLTIATLAVVARVYSRAWLIRQFGYDDACAIVAYAFTAVDVGIVLSNIQYGLGRHTATLDLPTMSNYLRTFYLSIVFYGISLLFIKTTFLLQYYRVLGPKWQKTVLGIGIFVTCWSLSQFAVSTFGCHPISKFWNLDPTAPGSCVPNLPYWYINAAGNVITDVIIFCLPLPALFTLNLRLTQRLLLIGVFSLGFFTCAISIIRIQYLHLSPDTTMDNVPSSSWSMTELCSGVTCVCLPTLKPLLAKVLPRLDSSQPSQPRKRSYNSDLEGRSASFGSADSPSHPSSSGAGSRQSHSRHAPGLLTRQLESVMRDTDDNSSGEHIILQNTSSLPPSSDEEKLVRRPEPIPLRGEAPPAGPPANKTLSTRSSVVMDQSLGLHPTVETEIRRVTPPTSQTGGWTQQPRGIAVKRDVVQQSDPW